MQSRNFEKLGDDQRDELTNLRNEFLFKAMDIIEKHGGRPFLDCGTLLGAVRDGGYIAWDSDIDLGIKVEEVTPEMQAELREHFNVRFEGGKPENGLFAAYAKRAEDGSNFKYKRQTIWFDLYMYYPYIDDITIMKVTTGKSTKKCFTQPAHCLDELEQIDFYGRKVWIPTDHDAWLTSWYGDWRTPDPDHGQCTNWFYEKEPYDINKFKATAKKLF